MVTFDEVLLVVFLATGRLAATLRAEVVAFLADAVARAAGFAAALRAVEPALRAALVAFLAELDADAAGLDAALRTLLVAFWAAFTERLAAGLVAAFLTAADALAAGFEADLATEVRAAPALLVAFLAAGFALAAVFFAAAGFAAAFTVALVTGFFAAGFALATVFFAAGFALAAVFFGAAGFAADLAAGFAFAVVFLAAGGVAGVGEAAAGAGLVAVSLTVVFTFAVGLVVLVLADAGLGGDFLCGVAVGSTALFGVEAAAMDGRTGVDAAGLSLAAGAGVAWEDDGALGALIVLGFTVANGDPSDVLPLSASFVDWVLSRSLISCSSSFAVVAVHRPCLLRFLDRDCQHRGSKTARSADVSLTSD